MWFVTSKYILLKPRRRERTRQRYPCFESLEPRLPLAGTGLTGQYFHNSDFTGLSQTRTEAVAFNWGNGAPVAGVDADTFSVRWTGQIAAQFSELYSFSVLSDEGARVWVDGQLLVNDWTSHLRRFGSGTIALEAGQRYDIRIDYFEGTGAAQIALYWSSASQPFALVPASQLYESPAGILGAYSDSSGGRFSRIDSTVGFNWGLAAPDPSLNSDGFKVTWTGQVRADFSEQYHFSTISDDGVRLWIGNENIIDDWNDHVATEDLGAKWLEAGKWYDVRLEYYENTNAAQIEWRWGSVRQTGPDLFETVPTANLRATKWTPVTFENPLGPGADPFVTQWQGLYFETRSDGNSVWINRASSLQEIHENSSGSDTILAWSAPAGTNYSEQDWAPELHQVGGKWYIYVAASDGNNATHRMQVLVRDDPDPFGAYVYVGEISAATDRWAIDGTVLQWQNTYYFIWSGWPGSTDGQQNLYIAEMRNAWTLRGDRVQISAPQYTWEEQGLPINEAPQVLIHNGQLSIIYSASGFWTNDYALGRLAYNGTGSLLSASSWIKSPQPVFQATSQVAGPGSASFTKSPDGTEDWIIYHAHANPVVWNDDRDIRLQQFTYFADGTPDFGAPLPPHEPILAPSSGADPERPFVTGDFNADGVVDSNDYNVWLATFGALVFPGSSADGNGDGVIDAGDYTEWRDNYSATATLVARTVPLMKDSSVQTEIGPIVADPDPPTPIWPALGFSRTNESTVLLQRTLTMQLARDAAFEVWREPPKISRELRQLSVAKVLMSIEEDAEASILPGWRSIFCQHPSEGVMFDEFAQFEIES